VLKLAPHRRARALPNPSHPPVTSPTDLADDKPYATIAEWKKIVAQYQVPSLPRAIWQLVNTFVPYIAVWYAMYVSLAGPYWITLALALLAGLLVTRVFIFFHDCGHGSFFKSKVANDVLGFITGMLTFTPYLHWRWQHAVHHGASGDLDRRGDGDIWTMTVREYQAASPGRRFNYRLSRNPFVLFCLAPLGLLLIYQRFSSPRAKGKDRASVYWMNFALALMAGGMCWLCGWQNYLLMQLPVTFFAGSIGIWMFYVQHQYEDVYWDHHAEWDYTAAALQGSSYYKLPRVLQWFTGNIGFHHIHHLSARIPNYNLEECHFSHPLFQKVRPITLGDSFKCMSLRLWDEKSRRLVGYSALRQTSSEAEAEDEANALIAGDAAES
jgi:acyl-lipid omega-6 desaturase (Delta-12 desaturase)